MSIQDAAAQSAVKHTVKSLVVAQLSTHEQLSLLDKLALWSTWFVAGAIFMTLGWMAMAPADPLGAVSLLMRDRPLAMWIQAAGLAVVTSALATIVVGRIVPYAGVFAAAVGLVAVTFRGGTAESLLIAARTSQITFSTLAFWFAVETIAWAAVMTLALLTAVGIGRWCFPKPVALEPQEIHSPPWAGLSFLGIAFAIGMLSFVVLGAGMHSREIRHPQVCFVVGASAWLACHFAFRLVPATSVRWYVITAMLVALAGYGWAMLREGSTSLPLSVPPSNFLRVLPIEFVAVGVGAAIMAYWSNLRAALGAAKESNDDSEEGD